MSFSVAYSRRTGLARMSLRRSSRSADDRISTMLCSWKSASASGPDGRFSKTSDKYATIPGDFTTSFLPKTSGAVNPATL